MKKKNKGLLPSFAYGRAGDRIVVIIKEEDGHLTTLRDENILKAIPRELNLEQRIDYLNSLHGVTKAQRQAMEFGSLFGWNLPLADPDLYNENGILLLEKLKNH